MGTRPYDDLLLAALCAVMATALLLTVPSILTEWNFNDFGTFYRAGCSGRLYEPDAASPRVGELVFVNLSVPHAHLAFLPLCAVPLSTAYWAWMALSVLTIGLGTYLTVPGRVPFLVWLALALSAATSSLFITGQITALLLPFVLLAWKADIRHRPMLAGGALGIAISLKVFLALPLAWWFLRREWTAVASAVVAAVLCFAMGAVAYGPESLVEWVRNLGAAEWPWAAFNASLMAPWVRAFSRTPYYTPLVISDAAQAVTTLVSYLVVTTVTCIALLKRRTASNDGWALCLVSALLLSPLGWAYYGWLLVPVLLSVSLPRWAFFGLAVTWSLTSIALVGLSVGSGIVAFTLGGAYTWGLIAAWSALVLQTSRESQSALPSTPPPANEVGTAALGRERPLEPQSR